MCRSAPKVRGVIPVYHDAEYLILALDSVLAPDFNDFKVILYAGWKLDGVSVPVTHL